jgi:hypothetical protein
MATAGKASGTEGSRDSARLGDHTGRAGFAAATVAAPSWLPNGDADACAEVARTSWLGAFNMTKAGPESPATAVPRAKPELPVRQTREIEPKALVRLMAQLPVPPEVTRALA